LLILFFVSACQQSDEKDVEYKIGFPERLSSGLRGFLLASFEASGELVKETEDSYIYSHIDIREEQRKVWYSQIKKREFDQYVVPLFQTNQPKNEFNNLLTAEKLLTDKINTLDYDLPEITLNRDQSMDVRTSKGSRSFHLAEMLKEDGIKSGDELSVKVILVNKQEFLLCIKNMAAEKEPYTWLFMKQDFSKVLAVDASNSKYEAAVLSGELDAFKDLVYEPLNKQFSLLKNSYGVMNRDSGQIQHVKSTDLVSRDGKYVYLKGKQPLLTEDTHHIQKRADYVAGNRKDAKTFTLDYKKIASKLGFSKSPNIHRAEIKYFSDDFVVLSLSYKSYIADAGRTNVLIDLHNLRKTEVYLVDLGLN